MKDIRFDIGTREIVMKNNDFATTVNPSVQNGGILLMSKGANPRVPWKGIGLLPGIIEGAASILTYDMNRWKSQAIDDGATLAKWTAKVSRTGIADFKTDISYL